MNSTNDFSPLKTYVLVEYLPLSNSRNEGNEDNNGESVDDKNKSFDVLHASIIEGDKMPGEIVELERRGGIVRKAIFLGSFSSRYDGIREMNRLIAREAVGVKRKADRVHASASTAIKFVTTTQSDMPNLSPPLSNFSTDVINSKKPRLVSNNGGGARESNELSQQINELSNAELSLKMNSVFDELSKIKNLLVVALQNQQNIIQRLDEVDTRVPEYTFCTERIVNDLISQYETPEDVAVALADKIFNLREQGWTLDNRDRDKVKWLRHILEFKFVNEKRKFWSNNAARDLWCSCRMAINATVFSNRSKRAGDQISLPLSSTGKIPRLSTRRLSPPTPITVSMTDQMMASTSKHTAVPPKVILATRRPTVFRPLYSRKTNNSSTASMNCSESLLPHMTLTDALNLDTFGVKERKLCRRSNTNDEQEEDPPNLSEMPKLLTMNGNCNEEEFIFDEVNQDTTHPTESSGENTFTVKDEVDDNEETTKHGFRGSKQIFELHQLDKNDNEAEDTGEGDNDEEDGDIDEPPPEIDVYENCDCHGANISDCPSTMQTLI